MNEPNQFLVRIALVLLREGVTPDEAEQMVNVLISRKNKIDNAVKVVEEAQRQRRIQGTRGRK